MAELLSEVFTCLTVEAVVEEHDLRQMAFGRVRVWSNENVTRMCITVHMAMQINHAGKYVDKLVRSGFR